MQNSIYQILSGEFKANQFIRIGNNTNINTYVGKDDDGRFAFDFRGKFKHARTKSSEVISVIHLECEGETFLRFSLINPALLEYFCTFCEDLLTSTAVICDDETAYQTLRTRYYSWKELFRPNHGLLNEMEIMGLIGELLFLRDDLIPTIGADAALDSWTGSEKTHKDFSFENEWTEVKTISTGKESVRISSIEQLDGPDDGYLVVYSLERMSPSYNGIKLNILVKEILSSLKAPHSKQTFLSKLSLSDYDFSNEYDNYVYDLKTVVKYVVKGEEFPRLRRDFLPDAITKAQYEISLVDLEKFRILDRI